MSEHVHTGPFMFIYIGVSAIIFENLMRLIAIWLESRAPSASRAIGGLLNFSGSVA